ncbi:MAG: hypothetical protein KatS3mg057_2506 [Herpetosiphonaceae bacterium]|nr:MAG: hypothetical protein KatS3mg057_2506 [Herpetosiphonaceae bacterium]
MFGRKRNESKIDLEPIDLGRAPDEALPTRRSSEPDPISRREAPMARSARGRGTARTGAIDIGPSYKFMIFFSFGLNLLLLLILAVLGLQLFILKNGLGPAKPLVRELDSAVAGLQNATIKTTVPLSESLPITLKVPVKQDTTVVTIAPVPLNDLPARIVFPGGGGQLNASVNLELPAGMVLPVHLEMTIPLTDSVPVRLSVPVNIPLRETELGPPFEQLGNVVKPLKELVDPQ